MRHFHLPATRRRRWPPSLYGRALHSSLPWESTGASACARCAALAARRARLAPCEAEVSRSSGLLTSTPDVADPPGYLVHQRIKVSQGPHLGTGQLASRSGSLGEDVRSPVTVPISLGDGGADLIEAGVGRHPVQVWGAFFAGRCEEDRPCFGADLASRGGVGNTTVGGRHYPEAVGPEGGARAETSVPPAQGPKFRLRRRSEPRPGERRAQPRPCGRHRRGRRMPSRRTRPAGSAPPQRDASG